MARGESRQDAKAKESEAVFSEESKLEGHCQGSSSEEGRDQSCPKDAGQESS
jgi:hypothetical protein